MDPRTALRQEHSRAQTDRIVAWADAGPERFGELVAIMLGRDRLLAQRAAWAVSLAGERRPEWVAPHLRAMVDHLATPGLHPAVIRGTFRLLQTVPVSGAMEGPVLAVAMAALGGTAPAAVEAIALTVLKRLAGPYPELLAEIRAVAEARLPDASPAFRSRFRREFGERDVRPTRRSC